jgi:glycosyltransferase involved in cell wall biosynthesis
MKILHVVHGYSPAVGGTQWLVQAVSERLVADFGDEVTVFTTVAYSNSYFWDRTQPSMTPGKEQIGGVSVRRFPVFNRFGRLRFNLARVAYRLRLPWNDWLRGLYFGPLIPSMIRAVAESGAEIVMASAFPLLHMHYALWGGQRAGIPTVFLGALHPVDKWCFERPMIYDAIRRCDAYLAYTTFEREYLARRGVDPDKVTIVGGGVDPDFYERADGSAIRRKHGWGADPIVAIVAQHLPHKRIDLVIQAMGLVWRRHPDARLLVVGQKTDNSLQLERLVAAYPFEQQRRIHFISEFTQPEKAAFFAACDLFVLPSSHEAFGIVFLEAWASGKPVIGSRIAALPAVIREGVDGLLVPYGDVEALARAISDLLDSPETRARMGEAGRRKVIERYTWDAVTRRIRELYDRLVSE